MCVCVCVCVCVCAILCVFPICVASFEWHVHMGVPCSSLF